MGFWGRQVEAGGEMQGREGADGAGGNGRGAQGRQRPVGRRIWLERRGKIQQGERSRGEEGAVGGGGAVGGRLAVCREHSLCLCCAGDVRVRGVDGDRRAASIQSGLGHCGSATCHVAAHRVRPPPRFGAAWCCLSSSCRALARRAPAAASWPGPVGEEDEEEEDDDGDGDGAPAPVVKDNRKLKGEISTHKAQLEVGAAGTGGTGWVGVVQYLRCEWAGKGGGRNWPGTLGLYGGPWQKVWAMGGPRWARWGAPVAKNCKLHGDISTHKAQLGAGGSGNGRHWAKE